MRIFVRLVALCLLALPLAAAAPEPAPAPANRTAASTELDVLFNRLKSTKNPVEAEFVQTMILKILSTSPSPTATLLYNRGVQALVAEDHQLAFDLFTAVTTLAPDFAEGWHELGAVNFALNAHDEALVDLEHALDLEPRHYAAMMGLASIFEMYGNKRGALQALRRAYAVNPHIDGLEGRINALAREVEGQGI